MIVIFIEPGLLFPFLPVDSLLRTADLLAASGVTEVPVWLVIDVAFMAAAAGDQVGFFLGHRFGRRWFTPEARVFKTKYREETEKFFARYGGPALNLGRFGPIVRTYVPLAAGTAKYHYRKFLLWNLTSAALWTAVVTMLGVLLVRIPFVRDHIDVIAIVIALFSAVPIVVSAFVRIRRGHHTATE